ncbi:MAG: 50S ribosomal protein L24 [Candidatus Omnitrophica bacterium]|nr:50S ribosomal protein L24 [Candidatus Omnitrophota bacterium]
MERLKIKKNDIVKVITGKDRGKQGKVFRVFPAKGRLLIEGINLAAKHSRPTKDNPKGGVIHREASIHISNVMLVDPNTQKPTRVGFSFLADGSKKRIGKKSQELIG